MTYQDVLDALDSILEKLRGNNSELCEKLGIEPDDPSITGEEDGEDEDDVVNGDAEQTDGEGDTASDVLADTSDDDEKVSEQTSQHDVIKDVKADDVAAAVLANKEEPSSTATSDVTDTGSETDVSKGTDTVVAKPDVTDTDSSDSVSSEEKKGFSDKLKDGFEKTKGIASDGFEKAKTWAKENPKTAFGVAAGTGLAAGLIGGALASKDDDDEDEEEVVNTTVNEDANVDKDSDKFANLAGIKDKPVEEPKNDKTGAVEPEKTEPKKDEPKAGEPKKTEPKKDEPKSSDTKEEPKKDEPKKDDEGFISKHKTALAAAGAGAAGLAVGAAIGNASGKKKERKRAEVGLSESDETPDVDAQSAAVEPPAETSNGILDVADGLGKAAVTGSENIKAAAVDAKIAAADIKSALTAAGGDFNKAADKLGMSVEELKSVGDNLGFDINSAAQTVSDAGSQLGTDVRDSGEKLGSDIKTAAIGGAAVLGGSMLGSALLKRRRNRS